MPKPPASKTKVSHSVKHDSLSVVVNFASGDFLRASMTRKGIRVRTGTESEDKARAVLAWIVKTRKTDSNGDTMEALALVCESCKTLADLVNLLAQI